MATTQISCLCLGPKQSGKTHLLTSLQAAGSVTNVSHSVPTIGTNIFRIKLPDKLSTTKITPPTAAASNKHRKSATTKSSKNMEMTVLEIGGSMAPMWKNYLSNVTKIIYVVDTSNLCQISAAGFSAYFIMPYSLLHTNYFFRCFVVHSACRSTASADQNPIGVDENGFSLSPNAQRSIANASI